MPNQRGIHIRFIFFRTKLVLMTCLHDLYCLIGSLPSLLFVFLIFFFKPGMQLKGPLTMLLKKVMESLAILMMQLHWRYGFDICSNLKISFFFLVGSRWEGVYGDRRHPLRMCLFAVSCPFDSWYSLVSYQYVYLLCSILMV